MPTIRDVAREAAVSIASVSRAMNGHSNVTDAVRQRVLEAADRLHYVPHSGARSLKMQRTNTIGVVLPDLFGEFFSEIIRGVDSVTHGRDIQLLLANMHGSAAETAAAMRAMRGRVDGLLMMSPQLDADFLTLNMPKGLPAVLLNGEARGAAQVGFQIDSFGGACRMVEHLVAEGRRNIAHIAGPPGNRDAEDRLRGFRETVAALTGEEDPLVLQGDFSEASGREAGRAVAGGSRPVDAVFAGNDEMAMGCLFELIGAGLSIPGDVAVAGFDDIPLARYIAPSLTTMRVRIAELGARAVESLLQRIEDQQPAHHAQEIVTPERVVRASPGSRP